MSSPLLGTISLTASSRHNRPSIILNKRQQSDSNSKFCCNSDLSVMAKRMSSLKKNMQVEVRMYGKGFEGAVWYEGRLQYVNKDSCEVIVYNLRNERNSGFLLEKTRRENVRPLPPCLGQFSFDCYEEGDAVEVFDRGGWWVGVITRCLHLSKKFSIYFREFGYGQDYSGDLVRVRQDWNMKQKEWIIIDSKFKKYAER